MPTPPEIQEEVFAEFKTSLSYAATGRKFKLPIHTVFDIVARLAKDDVAGVRNHMRARLAEKAWAKVERLIDLVRPETLGTEKASQGLEAARALGEIGRIAHLLDPPPPRELEQQQPATIIIQTSLPVEPAQLEAVPVTSETTTTADPKDGGN